MGRGRWLGWAWRHIRWCGGRGMPVLRCHRVRPSIRCRGDLSVVRRLRRDGRRWRARSRSRVASRFPARNGHGDRLYVVRCRFDRGSVVRGRRAVRRRIGRRPMVSCVGRSPTAGRAGLRSRSALPCSAAEWTIELGRRTSAAVRSRVVRAARRAGGLSAGYGPRVCRPLLGVRPGRVDSRSVAGTRQSVRAGMSAGRR